MEKEFPISHGMLNLTLRPFDVIYGFYEELLADWI